MTKLLTRIIFEVGWVSTLAQQIQQIHDSQDKRTELLRTRAKEEQMEDIRFSDDGVLAFFRS